MLDQRIDADYVCIIRHNALGGIKAFADSMLNIIEVTQLYCYFRTSVTFQSLYLFYYIVV